MSPARIALFITSLFCFYLTAFSTTAAILPAPPKVNAESYLLMDYKSGRQIAGHNVNHKADPASLTKMMTVYVVAEELASGNISMQDKVTVSEKAWRMPGSRMFIEVDTEVTVDELLHGVIVQSGNDASVALAEYISGTEEVFVAMMNQYAKELGMNDTHFVNSTGLPHEDHYTTAHDMAILARALISKFPEIYALHAVKEYTYNDIKQHNRNLLLWRDDSVDGIKTGHTEDAGYCLVASARRDDMRLISVVMGTGGENARARASQALLNFGFRFYETHKVYTAGEAVTTSPVWKGRTDILSLGLARDLWLTVPRGKDDELDARVNIESTIIAPVQKGSVLGNLVVSLDGEELARRPLVALSAVREGSLYERLKDEVRLWFQ
jgi:D-alanyl-D-alanine carboxypeptidase (penicillin-binding protein 5/6)